MFTGYKFNLYQLMNLTLLKDFFAYSGKKQKELQICRGRISDSVNTHSLFLALFAKASPVLTVPLLVQFMHSFHPQLKEFSAQLVKQYSSYNFLSTKQPYSLQQIVQKAAELMIKQWGSENSINFQQFSILVRGRIDLPRKEKPLEFKHKKHIFDLLEKQMQSLLDLQLFRKALALEYSNISDLFETITCSKLITKNDIDNLFLMNQQRKTQQELDYVQKRIHLPLDYDGFLGFFNEKSKTLKHKQIKIYHSTKKVDNKLKFGGSISQQARYQTPGKFAENFETTAISKAYNREDLQRSDLKISQFTLKQTGQAKPDISVLGSILRLEEQYNLKKRNLVMRQDCDLELVYQRFGQNFQQILNKCYGVCNFSAFVRFLVPHDFQHKYLSFIRYKADNEISYQVQSIVYEIIQAFHSKEEKIQNLWKKVDKQMIFRGFCLPRETNISEQQFYKVFTARQAENLLDRMDPHKNGYVSLQYFQ